MVAMAAVDFPGTTPVGLTGLDRQQELGQTASPGSVEARLPEADDEHLVINRDPARSSMTAGIETSASPLPARGTTLLDEALGVLKTVALADKVTPGEVAQAARLLRGAALERRLSAPRVAGLALLVSDALLFTEAADFPRSRRIPLRTALTYLSQPFIAQSEEGQVVDAFLDNGWELTASFDADEFAGITA